MSFRTTAVFMSALIFVFRSALLFGAPVSWFYDADGSWSLASNWSSDPSLPAVNDDVIINQPGNVTVTIGSGAQMIHSLSCSENLVLQFTSTLTLAADSQISSLSLTSALNTVGGAGSLAISRAFVWNNGTLSGSGKMTLAATCGTTITGGTLSRVLENAGIANFNNFTGPLSLNFSNGTFNNLASGTFNVIDIATTTQTALPFLTSSIGSVNIFKNAGTFNFTAPVAITRTSSVQFDNSGTLNVQSGTLGLTAGGINSGVVNVAAGSDLTLTNYENSAVINLQGVTSSATATTLTTTAFANASSGKINVSGGAATIAGTGTNLGEFNVASNATLTIGGSSELTQGTGSRITGAGGLVLKGGLSSFAGLIELSGPISFSGPMNFSTDQTLVGPVTMGRPQLSSSEAILGSGNILISNSFTWHAGKMEGAGKTVFGPISTNIISITGTANVARVLDNAGYVDDNITNSSLPFSSGTFNNLAGATFNINQLSGTATNAFSGTSTNGFSNAGTLNFNGITGDSLASSVPINNSGVFNVKQGDFVLTGGGSNSGTVNVFPGAGLTFPGSAFMNSGTINLMNSLQSFAMLPAFTNAATGQINVTCALATLSGTPAPNAGKINVPSGTMLTVSTNYTQLQGSSVNGAGDLIFNGISDFSGQLNSTGSIVFFGPMTFNADQNLLGNVTVRSNIAGFGNLVSNGTFLWNPTNSTSVISSGGKLTLRGNSVFGSLSLGSPMTLSRLIENRSVLNWNFGQNFTFSGGTLNNLADGTINLNKPSGSVASILGTGTNALNNFGSFNKIGTGTSTFPSGVPFNNLGIVSVQQGSLEIANGTHSGSFTISSGATLRFNQLSPIFNTGTNFAGGGTLYFGTITILPGPSSFSGTTIVSAQLQLAQALALQNSSVELIGGSFDFGPLMTAKLANLKMNAGATINFELGGSTQTLYDRLNITGAAILDGTLRVSLANNFMPTEGNVFDILDATTISGAFTTLQLPPLSGPLAWDTTQLYTSGELSIHETFVPGDLNRDGQATDADIYAMLVALTDLPTYQTSRGLSDTELRMLGDFNNSGTVTNADLQPLLSLITAQAGSGELSAVPEPASLVSAILGLGIFSAVALQRRGRRFFGI